MKNEVKIDFNFVSEILQKYDFSSENLVHILQDLQNKFGYLPEAVLANISTKLSLPISKIYEMATFFSHFNLEPKGKNIVKVCNGRSCHLNKSDDILDFLQTSFALTPKKNNSDDNFISLETVSCFGACGMAPVVVVNDEVHGEMTVDKTRDIIETLKVEEQKCISDKKT